MDMVRMPSVAIVVGFYQTVTTVLHNNHTWYIYQKRSPRTLGPTQHILCGPAHSLLVYDEIQITEPHVCWLSLGSAASHICRCLFTSLNESKETVKLAVTFNQLHVLYKIMSHLISQHPTFQ